MKIKMFSKSGRYPQYKTAGAAGMDVTANLDKTVIIPKGKRALVPTGLFMEIPEGYECQIRARSGLAVNYGIGLVNGIGTLDSDYRGELMVPLINWGEDDFLLNDGDRVAQIVFSAYSKVSIETCEILEQLGNTERGTGGFGHTGV